MVIIGEPGGGKTAAAILLLLEICKARTPNSRVPVFLQLAAWRADKVSLNDWIAEQLTTTYGAPSKIATLLVEEDRILPLLDGLDEVPEPGRREAITALRRLADAPFVLTCRASEYTNAVSDAVLEGAGVVEVTPVSTTTAIKYLDSSGSADSSRWDDVIQELRAPGPNPCKSVLSNPLMLSLARIIFESPASSPSMMRASSTSGELEDRLIDGLLPAVYGRVSTDIPVNDASRWLCFFADKLPILGPGSIGWWWLPLCTPRWRARAAAALAYAAVGAVFITIALSALLSSRIVRLDYGVLVFLFSAICLLAGASVRSPRLAPSYWARPRLIDVVNGLINGLGFGLLWTFCVGFLGITLEHAVNITAESAIHDAQKLREYSQANIGIIIVAFVGFVIAVIEGVLRAFSKRQVQDIDPVAGFRGDLRTGLAAGIMAAVGVSLLVLLPLYLVLIGAVLSPEDLFDWATIIVFLGGVLFFWFVARYSSVVTYLASIAVLAPRKKVPVHPLRFLEDAYQRGLLRKSGMAYEFRHARLAERLKSRPSDADEADS
jgi:hypothetical protein